MSEPSRAFSDSIDIGVLGNELITDILSEI
jgi:hypothetical protein